MLKIVFKSYLCMHKFIRRSYLNKRQQMIKIEAEYNGKNLDQNTNNF